MLVLHELFTAGMGIGFVLVLVGSTLATRRARPIPAGRLEEPLIAPDP